MIRSSEILGAEIQYFRTDPRHWPVILKRFKDAGLRCVTSYVQWGTHAVGAPDSRHPAGVLDFDGKTDPRLNLRRFIALVEKEGLNLNFRAGPFCCNEMAHGGYPPWIVMGTPDTMVWDYQNRTTQGYWIGKKEGSQPSYLHPAYLDATRGWIAEADKVILPHLKGNGGCVSMINLDNEISYIVRDSFLDSDYNPVNVSPGGFYHQFLAEKYGSARNLPYPRRFASIEEVAPPRSVPETIGDDLAWYVDWSEFKTWAMCQYIRRLREMHEANGARDVCFMTNFNPHRPEGIPTRMPDFERATRGIVGYDFYRGTFMSYSGYHSMARVLKLMNASLRYTWSAEFMSGTWNKILSSRVSDDHMRFMARCALAHGCKAISWFMFHDRDCWGDAPVSSHGHVRTSLSVLRETADLVGRKVRDWDRLVPQTDVAVIYSRVQHQHTHIGDPMPCDDNALHVGKPVIDGVSAGQASQEYEGLFRVIEQAGVQAGAVDALHSVRPLRAMRLAFLPGSPVVETLTSEALRAYAAGGGTLVVSGPWPARNERGRPFRFLGVKPPRPRRDSATVRIGRGRVIWRPAYLALQPPEEEDPESVRWVQELIRKRVSRPHVTIEVTDPVTWVDWQPGGGHRVFRQPRTLGSAILHRGRQSRLLFVLNHYPDAATFRIAFPRDRVSRLVDLFSGERLPVRDGTIVLDLDRKSASVFRLEA
jgi:beta-galactosidase GanA